MTPKLLERVQDFFGMKPQVFKAKEDTITPDAVVDYKPTLAQRFAHELTKVVDQMLELEGEFKRMEVHAGIVRNGQEKIWNGKMGDGPLSQLMSKNVVEAALDDMAATFSASYGQAMQMSFGGKRSKRDKDALGYEGFDEPDLSLTDKRSTIHTGNGVEITFTKEVTSDNKIAAVKPRIEITKPDGEKVIADLSDSAGIQRIIDEGTLNADQINEILEHIIEPLKLSLAETHQALSNPQMVSSDALRRRRLDAEMQNRLDEATPGRFGPN